MVSGVAAGSMTVGSLRFSSGLTCRSAVAMVPGGDAGEVGEDGPGYCPGAAA